MGQVILGKPEVIRLALVCLLTEGHLLIEDVPGTGKTSLAKALAKSQDGTVSRVQFTPDLMPSDVTGVSIYDRQSSQFEFRPGPVFANIVVADEINRASPKTQSALLEAMEERQVTVDGTTYRLPRPFLVLATQNPVEMEGTYPLPEAQRDRFLARTAIGYPNPDAEIAMLAGHDRVDPLDQLTPVADTPTVTGDDPRHHRVQISPALRDLSGRTRVGHPHRCPRSGSVPPRAPCCTWPGGEGRRGTGRPGLRGPRRHPAAGHPGAGAPPAADRRGARRAPLRRGHHRGADRPGQGAAGGRRLIPRPPASPPGPPTAIVRGPDGRSAGECSPVPSARRRRRRSPHRAYRGRTGPRGPGSATRGTARTQVALEATAD